jgi:hypothetical protein
MVKPAKGFMTDDGNFFETEPEAEFHEAETALMVVLGKETITTGGLFLDQFMETCVTHKAEIRRYLDAYEAVNQQEATAVNEADITAAELERLIGPTGWHPQDDAAGSQADASIQPLTDNGHSDMSDVGGSPRSETVQDDTTRDGP